ncbi:MAG TPA: GIY-YIG nuclease family protein [Pirellulales bacterium]|nr:GIY-YIG nuclease family protein [Pirellulales bacterium]
MSFFVYVLVSESTGGRYIGQTNDVARRLERHNSADRFGKRFTAKDAGPWKLVYTEEFASRKEAMARERWLKSGVGREWLDETISR